MDNIHRVKQATITWVHTKHLRYDQDLCDCELFLDRIINRPSLGFLDHVTKYEVLTFETRHWNIFGWLRR